MTVGLESLKLLKKDGGSGKSQIIKKKKVGLENLKLLKNDSVSGKSDIIKKRQWVWKVSNY
jgi:hypothetical protein